MKTQALPMPVERRVPFTYDRAATELIQCRRHLDAARGSLQLALEIFCRLDGTPTAPWTAALEQISGQLERAGAALGEAARRVSSSR